MGGEGMQVSKKVFSDGHCIWTGVTKKYRHGCFEINSTFRTKTKTAPRNLGPDKGLIICILISVLLRRVYEWHSYSSIFPKIPDYFRRFPYTTEDFRRLLKMSEDYRVTFVLPWSLLRYSCQNSSGNGSLYLEMRRLPEEFNLLCVDA